MHHISITVFATALILSTTAQAQEEDAGAEMEAEVAIEEDMAGGEPGIEEESAPEETVAEPVEMPVDDQAASNSKSGGDGMRFRFGVSGGPGIFSAKPKGGGTGASFTYGGLDLRFGAQINDLVGVYAQPVLGYYSTSDIGILAVGGLLGASVIADVTLIDHFFVGAGVGHHIYNNPGGPSLVLRAGGYPLMGRSKEKIRRKGLMLGADLRVTFLDAIAPVVHPTFNIGYEAF